MKKLYEEQKHSFWELKDKLGVSYMTLYKYALKEKKISVMQIGLLKKLAKAEGLEPMELYNKMCNYLKSE